MLAALAGVLMILGLPSLETTGLPADALSVVFLLSPAIVVPTFFELLPPCRGLGWDGSMSVLAKFALLNLCFVLPIAGLVQADVGIVHGLWDSQAIATSQPASRPTRLPTSAPIAPTTARVTAVVAATSQLHFPSLPSAPLRADLLVLLGAMLLIVPIAAGGQKPGAMEAGALLACYFLSLALVMASMFGRR